jgi:Domain of unknown function (DUF4440)
MNTGIDARGSPQVGAYARPRLRYSPASAEAVLDDLAAAGWVQAFDAAWLGRDWCRPERYLAADVELLPQGGADVVAGRAAVLGHLRRCLDGVVVHEYSATDLRARVSGAISIVTYRWQLDRTVGAERAVAGGRDMLALRAVGDDRQLGWRIQLRP